MSLTLHQSLCSSSSSKFPNSQLRSSFFSSSSSSSSSAPNSLDLGFPKPDAAPPFSASANISSLASTTRHYARCYWELSKARLRFHFLNFPLINSEFHSFLYVFMHFMNCDFDLVYGVFEKRRKEIALCLILTIMLRLQIGLVCRELYLYM